MINDKQIPLDIEKPLKNAVDLAATNKKTVVAKIENIVITVKPGTSLSAAYEQYEQIRYCNFMFEKLSRPCPRASLMRVYNPIPTTENLYHVISESVVKKAIKNAIYIAKKENENIMVALDYYNVSVNGSTNLENETKQYFKQLDIISRMEPTLRIRRAR